VSDDEAGALHRGQVRLIVSGFPSMVVVVVAIAGNSDAHSELWRCDPRASLAMCFVYFSGGGGGFVPYHVGGTVLPCSLVAIRPPHWPSGLYLGRSLVTLYACCINTGTPSVRRCRTYVLLVLFILHSSL
jgi:hypothetical protein